MSLSRGTRLGPYEIVSPLGAGGMGEVYTARDTRLERTVAVKVLPERLSSDEQLRARFEREAKTVSSLNHPHICTVHDVGREGETDFLVMELLEGESLSSRLERGPLAVEESLRYAIQIADALEKAHRHGVVHRDLKPGNVMLTATGAKLLDFGLAKATGPATGESSAALSSLPTQQRDLTEAGTVLGTFQYMAPEQLEGGEADARTDIFAFGALLYEMLTGRKAFSGKSKMSLVAAILEHEPPPVSTLQPLSPPALERLIRTCLHKSPEERWQTAHDLKLQLRWIEEGGSEIGLPAPVTARRKRREHLAWAVAALALAGAAAFAGLWLAAQGSEGRVARLSMLGPEGTSLRAGSGLALSPDGSQVVFAVGEAAGRTRLFLRRLDELTPRPVTGTEGSSFPFWSADGSQIAFFVGDKLKRVAASGGPPQTICDAPGGRGGAWGPDGTIVFSSGDEGGRGALFRVAAGGGTPQPLTKLDAQRREFSHRWPAFLPDGKHFLFVAQTGEGSVEDDQSTIEALSLESGARTRVMQANSSLQYVPSGHILFWREGSVLAQPFDPKALAVSGDPVLLIEGVGYTEAEHATFSASAEGTLVYARGDAAESQFTWFDRSGKSQETIGEASSTIRSPALSGDGSRLAYDLSGDIWVRSLERGTATRLSFSGSDGWPIWSPDDEWIAYASDRSTPGVYRKRASGLGEEELVLPLGRASEAGGPVRGNPRAWFPDGRGILCSVFHADTRTDIARLDLADQKLEILVRTPFNDEAQALSPDGRWLLATSDESGRRELHVHRLTKPGGRWQVSANGGSEGSWSRDGRTIFYWSPTEGLIAIEVDTRDGFRVGRSTSLMSVPLRGGFGTHFAVSPDGSRFLLNAQLGGGRDSYPLTVVQGWPSLLRRQP